MNTELSAEKLRWICDPQVMGCNTSEEMKPLETIIGQERAVRSLRFGLGIKELGFNIFVAGLPGTGRTTAVERFLEEVAKGKSVPDDWCYVNNFRDSYRPKAMCLPPGRAKEFKADMKILVEGAQREIQRVFESEEYAAKKEGVAKAFEERRDEILGRMNERAQEEGFLIQFSPIGLMSIPLKEGKPLSEKDFLSLDAGKREEIQRKQKALQSELEAIARQAKGLEKGAHEELHNLDQEIALYALSHLIGDLQEKYEHVPQVLTYLDQVKDDILQNLSQFRSEGDDQPATPFPMPEANDQPFRKYEVDVLVDNSELEGSPVVVEMNPTYNNLFGRIEQEARFGALVTDFTLIRDGSLHQANGGYLVLSVEEVLRNPFAWDSLKRALRNREITIESMPERLGFMTTKSLQPEPVPLDVKIILIGQPTFYYLLRAYDEDFSELFKVKADFDTRMNRTRESIREYAAFVGTTCDSENLKHLDNSALARIVEHGSRLAEDQEKLSARFGEIADIIREANFYAAQENSTYVTGSHVTKAVDERFTRSNLLQERIQEMIERGAIMIDVAGAKVGQVNGLSVIDLGDISFGRPSRITVSIGLGSEGLVDIEREAKLGGPLHSKGVMILAGYLMDKYTQDKPLSLSARLVFEQSYSGVEGDSASSTELYAILSGLSGLPIKQGIAVTGSVNQKGEVQAIGGVNQKIEGFFEVCKARGGLIGEQGVIVPGSNVTNLMLKDEVVQAVRDGKFHVWSVRTIDEGIEILTGVEAGQKGEDGTYAPGSVNGRVDLRLRELAESLREFSGPAEKKDEN